MPPGRGGRHECERHADHRTNAGYSYVKYLIVIHTGAQRRDTQEPRHARTHPPSIPTLLLRSPHATGRGGVAASVPTAHSSCEPARDAISGGRDSREPAGDAISGRDSCEPAGDAIPRTISSTCRCRCQHNACAPQTARSVVLLLLPRKAMRCASHSRCRWKGVGDSS